jgi:hypothetical protein
VPVLSQMLSSNHDTSISQSGICRCPRYVVASLDERASVTQSRNTCTRSSLDFECLRREGRGCQLDVGCTFLFYARWLSNARPVLSHGEWKSVENNEKMFGIHLPLYTSRSFSFAD